MADENPRVTRFAYDQQRRITAATAIGMKALLKPIMHFRVSMLRARAGFRATGRPACLRDRVIPGDRI